jgi:hypothetical protein
LLAGIAPQCVTVAYRSRRSDIAKPSPGSARTNRDGKNFRYTATWIPDPASNRGAIVSIHVPLAPTLIFCVVAALLLGSLAIQSK